MSPRFHFARAAAAVTAIVPLVLGGAAFAAEELEAPAVEVPEVQVPEVQVPEVQEPVEAPADLAVAAPSSTNTHEPSEDLDPPVVSVFPSKPLTASGWSIDRDTQLVVTADDESGVVIEYRRAVEGGGWSAWATAAAEAEASFSFPDSGEFGYQFRATDDWANVSDPVEFFFQADYEISGATISGFPGTFALGESYDLVFGCADALSGVASCTSSLGSSGIALPTNVAGNHSFTLTNTDVAGNSKTTTWEYSVVGEDTTAPTTTVTTNRTPSASGWFSGETQVTAQASDDNSGVAQLWVEATGADPLFGQFVDGTSFLFTSDVEGETVFMTYAIDAEGNSSTPQYFTLRIDRTAPTIDITSPANDGQSLVAALKTFTHNDSVALEFECEDALSGIASCEGPSVLPTAVVGTNTVEIVAIDNAGNRTVEVLEYEVVAAPIKPAASTSSLASTGLEIWVQLLFVAGLLAAGVSFLVVSRQRR